MSDYIKREDAIFVALQQPLYSVVSQIKQLDGIDIVRCGECKYKFMHGSVWECLYGLMIPSPDGFCSYGERESDE